MNRLFLILSMALIGAMLLIGQRDLSAGKAKREVQACCSFSHESWSPQKLTRAQQPVGPRRGPKHISFWRL